MAEENFQHEGTVKQKPNLNRYIDKFFEKIILLEDTLQHTHPYMGTYYHNYKSLLKASIDVFISHQSEYTAFQVYETFLMMYQILPEDKNTINENSQDALISEPNTLLNLVRIMQTYEEKTGMLINHQRDHFIHSVNVFIFGLAIYAQNKHYRKIFHDYITDNEYYKKYYQINGEFSHEEFLYRWGIAALFHDIGYPFEIIGKQLDKYVEDSVNSISINYDVDAHIDFRDFDEFNAITKLHPYNYADKFRSDHDKAKVLDLFRPTDIMAYKIAQDFQLSNLDYKKLIKNLKGFIKHMNERGFIDHGYFSAILVLNSYGKLIQKYAKNSDFFFYPIVDSATAILLHNYYHNTLQKKQFNFKKLKPHQSPISYLLILCDELQEWNRRPYGVENKNKNQVNDMKVHIDDNRLEVTYILKNGSLGLGFTKKKDEYIYDVLDVDAIFPRKLSIVPQVDLEKIRRQIVFSEADAPHLLLRNIEKLAIKINDLYNETTLKKLEEYRKDGNEEKIKEYEDKVKYLVDFDDLSPDFKMSNIRQAKSIPIKLEMIGCEITHMDNDDMPEITEFSEEDIESLAIFEHEEWCKERKGMGWTYGTVKNVEKRITPYLCSWEELKDNDDTEKIKDYDRDSVRSIPILLNSIGLKVVRSRIKSLTYKMNQLYETGRIIAEIDGEEEFNRLPHHIQFSNYQQANHLVEILRDSGYELVPVTSHGTAVEYFDEEEINYFAEREHECWYQLKLNLDEVDSDNFLPWEEVSSVVKYNNRRTFARLPELCADSNVGLKIIRSE